MTVQKDNHGQGVALTPEANHGVDLVPGYMLVSDASKYSRFTERKLSLYRRYGLLKAVKAGKAYVYRKEWLDEFMDEWAGYDLSSEAAVKLAIKEKDWKRKHE